MCKLQWLLTLCAPTMIAAAEPIETVLENQTVRLCVKGPQVTALYDKMRQRDYIAPEGDGNTGLFHLVLARDGGPAAELDAANMTVASLRRNGEAINAIFDSTEASVSLCVRLADTPGELIWTFGLRPKVAKLALRTSGFSSAPIASSPGRTAVSVRDAGGRGADVSG